MTDLIERLVGSVPSWGARLAYGDKTTLNGQDFVPVAIVAFGFGGGQGTSEWPDGDNTGEGSGGGGGGYAVPIGAYVGGTNGLTFRPNPIAVIVAAVPLVTAVGVAIARLVR